MKLSQGTNELMLGPLVSKKKSGLEHWHQVVTVVFDEPRGSLKNGALVTA